MKGRKTKTKKRETEPEKEEVNDEFSIRDAYLTKIHWFRQIFGYLSGIIWGLLGFTGGFGILTFLSLNVLLVYGYFRLVLGGNISDLGEDAFKDIVSEGLMTSFSGFLLTWIILYNVV